MAMELYRQVSHTTHEALALPPRYLRMYGDFVTKNASAVSQIEGALRSLTYILPGTDSCLFQED
jgi:peroxin-16